MKGRHQFKRRFSLQPSFLKEESSSSASSSASSATSTADHQHATDVDRRNQHPRLLRSQKSQDTEGTLLLRHNLLHQSLHTAAGTSAAGTQDKNDPTNVRHKIVVMGPAKVGKSSIISQFLYGTFAAKYKRTIEEMHHSDFNVAGVHLMLDILDTSGSYEFPAMRALSIQSADAFILVFDISDNESGTFEEVRTLRDQIHEIKGSLVPIVIVGNKADLITTVDDHVTVESVVTVDWENGYVQTSACTGNNVSQVFKELLVQAKVKYNLSPALRRKRRQSLPSHSAGLPSASGTASHHSGAGSHLMSASSNVTPTHHGSSAGHLGSAAVIPSAVQLHHLQQIRDRHGKRNSCSIS